ncbi:hypothetical protein PAMP_021996 [Pampus punctatissimus]
MPSNCPPTPPCLLFIVDPRPTSSLPVCPSVPLFTLLHSVGFIPDALMWTPHLRVLFSVPQVCVFVVTADTHASSVRALYFCCCFVQYLVRFLEMESLFVPDI